MRFLKNGSMTLPLLVCSVLAPTQASATLPVALPEPVSLALLATGVAGLGAAEMIRRRKRK